MVQINYQCSPLIPNNCTFSEILRSFRYAVAPLLIAGGEAFGAAPENLAEMKDTVKTLEDASSGVNLLTQASRVYGLLKPSKNFLAVANQLEKANGALSKLSRGAKKVLEVAESEEEAKVGQEFANYKQNNPELKQEGLGYRAQFNALPREIDAIPVGLVDYRRDPTLVVTVDLVARDPKEAGKRLSKLADLMEANVKGLKDLQERLEKMSELSDKAADAFFDLEELYGDIHGHGGAIFRDFFAFKSLEMNDLGQAAGRVENAAKTKLAEIDQVLGVEERRLENLTTNLSTFWGINR